MEAGKRVKFLTLQPPDWRASLCFKVSRVVSRALRSQPPCSPAYCARVEGSLWLVLYVVRWGSGVTSGRLELLPCVRFSGEEALHFPRLNWGGLSREVISQ